MRRSAGSMALGRLVAATTLRWHPGPVQQYASAHGSCRRCWVTCGKAAGVGAYIVHSLLSLSGSQQCAGRLVTAEQQEGSCTMTLGQTAEVHLNGILPRPAVSAAGQPRVLHAAAAHCALVSESLAHPGR